MSDKAAESPRPRVRRPQRADARRNFDALLAAAREAFAEHGTQASLEDIARRAGVGIGTLYRNFPTRQDLFASVYLDEIDELCASAGKVADLPPWEALAAWLRRLANYAGTKRAVQEALNRDSGIIGSGRASIYAAGQPLFDRARQAGEVRDDVTFDDVVRMIIGVTGGCFLDKDQRERVLGMVLDGVRARPS